MVRLENGVGEREERGESLVVCRLLAWQLSKVGENRMGCL